MYFLWTHMRRDMFNVVGCYLEPATVTTFSVKILYVRKRVKHLKVLSLGHAINVCRWSMASGSLWSVYWLYFWRFTWLAVWHWQLPTQFYMALVGFHGFMFYEQVGWHFIVRTNLLRFWSYRVELWFWLGPHKLIIMFCVQLYTITTLILVSQTLYYDYVRHWFRSKPSEGYPVVSSWISYEVLLYWYQKEECLP